MENLKKNKITVADGFRFGLGLFLASQLLGAASSLVMGLIGLLLQRVAL